MAYVNEWPHEPRIISKLSYALSSLIHMMNDHCLAIVKKKEHMLKLLHGYREFYPVKAVVEQGGCLIALLAFANDETKEILRTYKVIEILTFIIDKNVTNLDISAHKQILRAFGNLSLNEKCAQETINLGFCKIAVKLAEQLNIFVNIEDKKMQFVRVLIDLISNLSSHKYKLNCMHSDGITSLIITLLEVTDNHTSILICCIDTIDGLCQDTKVETHLVKEKKLLYILVDMLKITED